MARSREGNGRHRQVWLDITCEDCGLTAKARRTLPGKPLHIHAHLDNDGNVCPPLKHGLSEEALFRRSPPRSPAQLSLF